MRQPRQDFTFWKEGKRNLIVKLITLKEKEKENLHLTEKVSKEEADYFYLGTPPPPPLLGTLDFVRFTQNLRFHSTCRSRHSGS